MSLIPLVVLGLLISGCAQVAPSSPSQSPTAGLQVSVPSPVRAHTLAARTVISGPIYPDLTSAPVGAWVTVYGIDTNRATWPIVRHGGGRTVLRVPRKARALVVGGKRVKVRIRAGRVVVATPATLRAAITGLRAGDTVYLRKGIYNGHYDDAGWNESNIVLDHGGTAKKPIAILGYPGERARLDNTGPDSAGRPNLQLAAGNKRVGSWVTIAGLELVAQRAAIYGGGNTSDSSTPESGAAHVRIVHCQLSITDAETNTGTGIVSVQGDSWKILGNTFRDPANREVINNNHAIYVQNGADNVEIAYNRLVGLHMGHTIQVHQDGQAMVYSNLWLHHNRISGISREDQRGITVSNVAYASTVRIEHNTISSVGQGFGAVTVYAGHVKVRANTISHVNGPAIMLNGSGGGRRLVTIVGNKVTDTDGVVVAVNGAKLSEVRKG